MPKKTRKQKQRSATQRPAEDAPGLQVAAATASRPAVAAAARAQSPPAAREVRPGPEPALEDAAAQAADAEPQRRRVGRVTPAGSPITAAPQRPAQRSARFGTAAAMVQPLETDDPAIPFDRVPYVPADLRRVAVIAGLMVVLILIAWAIVARVVS